LLLYNYTSLRKVGHYFCLIWKKIIRLRMNSLTGLGSIEVNFENFYRKKGLSSFGVFDYNTVIWSSVIQLYELWKIRWKLWLLFC
jgi:hypothetical protein